MASHRSDADAAAQGRPVGRSEPVRLVRGEATEDELDAVRHALGRRGLSRALRSWRAVRRSALARRPERLGDR